MSLLPSFVELNWRLIIGSIELTIFWLKNNSRAEPLLKALLERCPILSSPSTSSQEGEQIFSLNFSIIYFLLAFPFHYSLSLSLSTTLLPSLSRTQSRSGIQVGRVMQSKSSFVCLKIKQKLTTGGGLTVPVSLFV